MNNDKHLSDGFLYIVAKFFKIYLPGERGFSSNTITSYEDTIKILIKYFKEVKKITPEKITISNINRNEILKFLEYLEKNGCTISTRNQRLGAIKSFFTYIKYKYPKFIDIACEVLEIKSKKQPEPVVNYLSVEAVSLILKQPNLKTHSGYRDGLLLTIMYDTAARVSEISNVKMCDIRLKYPATITLHGKGDKDRIVPISKNTSDSIKYYLKNNKLDDEFRINDLLFKNKYNTQLTRAGISYILTKYVKKAKQINPQIIPNVITPHCLRHSKAMHLLQAGVALIYIRDFLGHRSVNTTEIYAKADSKFKRKALENAYNGNITPKKTKFKNWNEDEELMAFINKLTVE